MTEKEKEGEKKERCIKILLLGDTSVGKTCFLKRYTDDTFQDAYLSTIGFDYKFKVVTLKSGKEVKVQIWDTAGQERFRTIAKSYYRGAHGIILVFDVTNQKSFDNIRKWLNQIKEQAKKTICIVLIANKIDSDGRIVTKEEGERLAKESNLEIFEASAKEKINVNEAFERIIENISENYEANNVGVQLDEKETKKKKKKKFC